MTMSEVIIAIVLIVFMIVVLGEAAIKAGKKGRK